MQDLTKVINQTWLNINTWFLDVWHGIKKAFRPLFKFAIVAAKIMQADKKKQKYLIRRYSLR